MKKNSIKASAIQVSAAFFLIKVLGLFKQSLIAAVCGASAETDAYFVASGIIPHLCTVVFSAVSIPLLAIHTKRLVERGRESANNLVNAALRTFLPVAILLTAFFLFFAPAVAKVLAPAYQGEELEILTGYIRIMSFMFVFTGYYLIVNVVLETEKRFLPGKGQNFFQNLFICIAVAAFYPAFGMQALLYAFLAAGIVQCAQITWNARRTFWVARKVTPEKETIRRIFRLTVPLLIGNAIYEINDIVDKQIATALGHGNVSCLTYGASVNEIVTALVIHSISTVLFSHYATWVAQGEPWKVGNNLSRSLEYLVALILPIMVMCFACGDCIVDILYGRGNFSSEAALMTTGVVFGYAVGFLFSAARSNLVQVYYAFQNTRTPMINGAVSIAANVLLSLLLSRIFGSGGIALATSISLFLVSFLLLTGIRKYIPGFSLKGILPECAKAAGLAVLIGALAWLLRSMLPFGNFWTFICTGIFVAAAYLGGAYLLNIRAVKALAGAALGKIKKR